MPMIFINNTNILILFIQAIQSKTAIMHLLKKNRFIITDLPDIAAQDILKKYLCRWDIEVLFRDIKQFLNSEKAQVRSIQKLNGYLSMVLISSVFVQIIQIQNNINTVGETISFL